MYVNTNKKFKEINLNVKVDANSLYQQLLFGFEKDLRDWIFLNTVFAIKS